KQRATPGQSMEQELRQAGLTLNDVRYDIRVQLAQLKLITKGVSLTDADVRKFYDQNKATQFSTPAQVRIPQITLPSETKAKEARKDLDHADFGLVAMSRSVDMFKSEGGQVPPIPRNIPAGLPVAPQVAQKAFTMKPKQISEPVKVGSQFVIIKVED